MFLSMLLSAFWSDPDRDIGGYFVNHSKVLDLGRPALPGPSVAPPLGRSVCY